MFDRTNDSTELLQSAGCLSPSHTPATVVGREQEQQAIAAALQPLTRGDPADNLFVYGPAGGGKTTTVTYVCEQLVADSRVTAVRLNCWQYNTRSSLLSQLLIELGYPVPRKGKPVDELLRQLGEWLDKQTSIAVVLDEFDRQQDQTAIAYDLESAGTEASNELGLVLISNEAPAAIELDPRSESRLSYRGIPFRPYDESNLVAILRERASQAFRSDAVTDEAIAGIAEYVADGGGDCRQALELLHRAGRIAERAAANAVTLEHVERGMNPAQG